ncbi:lymphatic vessel endothelial hyaluronic acid receptor 1 [Rhinophrynus dorsalis]
MTSRIGFTCVLLSLVLWVYTAHGSYDVKDLAKLKCRIKGVLLAESNDHKYKFNYTTAESVCRQLGLQLASREQVEKARSYGFETCSYGWVADQIGVISRIQHNEKCGRNMTGVLTWTVELSRLFHTYCFNASDTWINSCKPEIMTTTKIPETTNAQPGPSDPPIATDTSNTTTTTQSQTTSALLHVLLTTSRHRGTTTFPTTFTTTPMTEPSDKSENQAALKNDKPVFGGLPTALLILALVFFIAAAVLAVCYVKKYKKHLLFTKKKEEKETVETKVFKETPAGDNDKTAEDKQTANGKTENLQTSPVVTTGNSVEAEV